MKCLCVGVLKIGAFLRGKIFQSINFVLAVLIHFYQKVHSTKIGGYFSQSFIYSIKMLTKLVYLFVQ